MFQWHGSTIWIIKVFMLAFMLMCWLFAFFSQYYSLTISHINLPHITLLTLTFLSKMYKQKIFIIDDWCSISQTSYSFRRNKLWLYEWCKWTCASYNLIWYSEIKIEVNMRWTSVSYLTNTSPFPMIPKIYW